MKFLVSGDLQLLCDDPGSPRSEQTRNTLSWIIREIDQHHPEVFVHLGDFGESNEGVDHYSLSLMTWFMRGVFDRTPKSYWLTGNHDFFTEDGSINLMSALGSLMPPNHKAVWPWDGHGPEGTMFVSYLSPGSRERWRADAGLVFAEREHTVLFSHLPVNGAMYSPGILESKGLDADWFPKQTIVGHYHRPNPPSQVQQTFGNFIWYAGSPMSHDFRDNCYGLTREQQLRGIWLFDISEGRITTFPTFLPNPHATYYLSFSSGLNNGAILDPWFNQQCVLPPERTVLRLTVPAGQESSTIPALSGMASHAVLREDSRPTLGPVGQAIDPDTAPSNAVQQYVQSLPEDRLKGLDPARLAEFGVSLVQQQYQSPVPQ